MANRKASDLNTDVAVMVRKATDSGRARGEDLIANPKLKKAFKAAKARAKKR
jgi:hypothetical protein